MSDSLAKDGSPPQRPTRALIRASAPRLEELARMLSDHIRNDRDIPELTDIQTRALEIYHWDGLELDIIRQVMDVMMDTRIQVLANIYELLELVNETPPASKPPSTLAAFQEEVARINAAYSEARLAISSVLKPFIQFPGSSNFPQQIAGEAIAQDRPANHDALDEGDAPKDGEAARPLFSLDDKTMTVYWRGRTCKFEDLVLPWALFERIAQRPGTRVSFDDLQEDDGPWMGKQVSDATIKGVITRLRRHLRDHQMADLAKGIRESTYRLRKHVRLELPSNTEEGRER